jgi:hypothetical protein
MNMMNQMIGNSYRNVITSEALRLYEVARKQGLMSKIWSTLSRHSHRLFDLETVRHTVNVHNRHYVGLQAVPLQQIRGSEGRNRDFDGQFRPLQTHTKHRWVNIAVAQQEGQSLPPVDLIQIGDIYFVRDGHHRLSVAQILGQKEIEADVTVWETVDLLPWEPQDLCNISEKHSLPDENVCI